MRRIITLKNCKHGRTVFRAGFYYAPPEDMAQDLVDRGDAYWEGDDPPPDPKEVAKQEAAAAREAKQLREQREREEAEKRKEEKRAIARARKQAKDTADAIAATKLAARVCRERILRAACYE